MRGRIFPLGCWSCSGAALVSLAMIKRAGGKVKSDEYWLAIAEVDRPDAALDARGRKTR
jgi:hypothetical protein